MSDWELPWRTIRSGTLWARRLRSRPAFLTLVTARTVFWSLAGAYATEIAFVKSRHSSRASVDVWADLAVHCVVTWLVTINRTEARDQSEQ